MKTAKQFSRQRTRHTFLLKAPADASCNAPCRLRGHGQPLSAHAMLSVPALSAFTEASADGASAPGQPRSGFRGVVPMQDRDDFLVLRQGPHRLFHQQIRPSGPSNRVAFLTRRLACQVVAFG